MAAAAGKGKGKGKGKPKADVSPEEGLNEEVADSGKGFGKKRKASISPEEGLKKVRKTIGWYNKFGSLQQTIKYDAVRDAVESINPRKALTILNEFEEKGAEIRDPTAWLRSAAQRVGPELDLKVRKTIAWFNKHGGLAEPIRYDEVKESLAWLSARDACQLLSGLEGKEVNNPTSWIAKAAWNKLERDGPSWEEPQFSKGWSKGKGGKGQHGKGKVRSTWQGQGFDLDARVKKTIGWYNKNGGLQAPIVFDEVAPLLAQMDSHSALQILAGLDPEKGGSAKVANPTGWISKAARNLIG